MNRTRVIVLLVGGLAAALGVCAVGCGEDEVFRTAEPSANDGGTLIDATGSPDAADASAPGSSCGTPPSGPQRLLLTVNNATTSELAAFNLADRRVDGRFSYAGFLGTTSSSATDPFVVEQANDVIVKMNAQRPWEPVSSWTVAGDDAFDGGSPTAQPVSVVVPNCGTGYVLRFNRNRVAVVDTSLPSDGGAPVRYVDLSSLRQAEDLDGMIDMTAAVYVPSKKRIYVLVGGYDRTTVGPPDYTLLCKNTTASIVAIDETSGELVSLGGTAKGGGIALEGYNPVVGAPLVYDAAHDRLLVLHGGCSVDLGGGAAGAVTRRGVEEVSLATGQVRTLVSLNDKGFPASFVYADETHAALTFFFPNQAFLWDPSKSALGAEIPGSFDYVSHDGKGNLVGGLRTTVDGGDGFVVQSVPFVATADGGVIEASSVTRLGQNPFTTTGGFLGGAEVWPR